MELRSTLEENLMFTRTLEEDRTSTPLLSVTHLMIHLSLSRNVSVQIFIVWRGWCSHEDAIVFAPIALIQSYETVEEAIELANGTKYGLGASVFGPDQTYAIQVAKQIKCGMVSVNDFGVFYVRRFGSLHP